MIWRVVLRLYSERKNILDFQSMRILFLFTFPHALTMNFFLPEKSESKIENKLKVERRQIKLFNGRHSIFWQHESWFGS